MASLKPLWKDFEYKEHQKYGVSWMIERENDKDVRGGMLCDEMGLGKTIQMLGLIKQTQRKATLLVLPLAVKDQWKQTAMRSHINVMYYVNHSWKLVSSIYLQQPIIYIIGYESLTSNIDMLQNIAFDRLVCDESQRLANKKSKTFKAIKFIQADCKWFLSATPIVNSINDVKSVFSLLNKDLEKGNLEQTMARYTLGRTMEQLRSLFTDLPSKPIIETEPIAFINTKEEEFYVTMQTKIENLMRFNENGLAAIRMLLMLRQLSIHPQVYIQSRKDKYKGALKLDDWEEESTKFCAIKDLLNAEKTTKHKWIIFCHFHSEMKMLKEYLSKLDHINKIEIYSGELSEKKKKDVLDNIKLPNESDKNTELLIIQLKSGGVGLNLQEFDRIIFTGPWWTQAIIEQGIGRAVRIGQTQQVVVHHLLLKREETMVDKTVVMNIDKKMNEKAKEKYALNNYYLSLADNKVKSDT
jgi:SNF2 family DNA or RNA helicase